MLFCCSFSNFCEAGIHFWDSVSAISTISIQYIFFSISAKYNAFGYIQYKAILLYKNTSTVGCRLTNVTTPSVTNTQTLVYSMVCERALCWYQYLLSPFYIVSIYLAEEQWVGCFTLIVFLITFVQIRNQIQVLTELLCSAWEIYNSLPNNEWRAKYRRLVLECFFLRSATAGRIYKLCANHASNSGFDRSFMPCSGYFFTRCRTTSGVPNIMG